MPSVASHAISHLPSHLHPSTARNPADAEAKVHNSPFAMLLDNAPVEPNTAAPAEAKPAPSDRTRPQASRTDDDQGGAQAPDSAPPAEATDRSKSEQAAPDPSAEADANGGEATSPTGDGNTVIAKPVIAKPAIAKPVIAKLVLAKDSAELVPAADPAADAPDTDEAAAAQAAAALTVAVDAPKPALPAVPTLPALHAAILPAIPGAPVQALAAADAPAQPAGGDPLAGLQELGDGAGVPEEAALQAATKKVATPDGGKPASTGTKTAEPDAPADKFRLHLAAEAVAAKATLDPANPSPQFDAAAVKTDAPIQVPSTAASAATPATNAAPSAPQAAPVPLSGIGVEIAREASAGKNRFEIRLDPPELGRIDVRLDVDRDGQVSTRLVVDRVDTLDMLKRDAGELQRALQQAGLKTSDNALEFSLRQQAFARDDSTPQGSSPVAVAEDDAMPVEAVRQGYRRLLGLGSGLDITV